MTSARKLLHCAMARHMTLDRQAGRCTRPVRLTARGLASSALLASSAIALLQQISMMAVVPEQLLCTIEGSV